MADKDISNSFKESLLNYLSSPSDPSKIETLKKYALIIYSAAVKSDKHHFDHISDTIQASLVGLTFNNECINAVDNLLRKEEDHRIFDVLNIAHNKIKSALKPTATDTIQLKNNCLAKLDWQANNASSSSSKTPVASPVSLPKSAAEPQECLRKVIGVFLQTQGKLETEIREITQRNATGSFFLSQKDVIGIKAKKGVIDEIIESIIKEIDVKNGYV